MRACFVTLFGFCLVFAGVTPSIAQPLALAGATSVRVVVPNNPISVTTGVGPFSATVPLGCDTSAVESLSGTSRTVIFDGPDQDCAVAISLPSSANIRIELGNGALQFSGAAASLTIDSGNGAVSVADVTAAMLTISAANGEVNVQRINAPLSIAGANGLISVEGLQGSLQLETSNNRVILKRLTLPAGSSSNINTANADVRINKVQTTISPETNKPSGLRIAASSVLGDVSIVFKREKFGKKYSRKGATPARLRIRSVNGDITVRP